MNYGLHRNQFRKTEGMTGVDPRHPVMQSDTVPAMLSPGEAVLNPVATQVAGPARIDALNKATAPALPAASRTPRKGFGCGGRVKGYAGGGRLPIYDVAEPAIEEIAAKPVGVMRQAAIAAPNTTKLIAGAGRALTAPATIGAQMMLHSPAVNADEPMPVPGETPPAPGFEWRGYGMGGIAGYAGGGIVPSEEFVDPRATPWIRRGAFNPATAEATPPVTSETGFIDPRVPPNSANTRSAPPGGVPNLRQPLGERVGNAVGGMRQRAAQAVGGILPAAKAALPQLGVAGVMAGVTDQVRADANTPEKQAEYRQFMEKIPGQGQTFLGTKLFDKPAPNKTTGAPNKTTEASVGLDLKSKPQLPNSSNMPAGSAEAAPYTVANETKGGVEWGDNYIHPGSGYDPDAPINTDGTGIFGGVDPGRSYGMGMKAVREGLADPNVFEAPNGGYASGGPGRGTVSVMGGPDLSFETESKAARHSAGMARLRAGLPYEEQPYDPTQGLIDRGMALVNRQGEIGDAKRRAEGLDLLQTAYGMRAKQAEDATQRRGQDMALMGRFAGGMGGRRGSSNPMNDIEAGMFQQLSPEEQKQWMLGRAGIHPQDPRDHYANQTLTFDSGQTNSRGDPVRTAVQGNVVNGQFRATPLGATQLAQLAVAKFPETSWYESSNQTERNSYYNQLLIQAGLDPLPPGFSLTESGLVVDPNGRPAVHE